MMVYATSATRIGSAMLQNLSTTACTLYRRPNPLSSRPSLQLPSPQVMLMGFNSLAAETLHATQVGLDALRNHTVSAQLKQGERRLYDGNETLAEHVEMINLPALDALLRKRRDLWEKEKAVLAERQKVLGSIRALRSAHGFKSGAEGFYDDVLRTADQARTFQIYEHLQRQRKKDFQRQLQAERAPKKTFSGGQKTSVVESSAPSPSSPPPPPYRDRCSESFTTHGPVRVPSMDLYRHHQNPAHKLTTGTRKETVCLSSAGQSSAQLPETTPLVPDIPHRPPKCDCRNSPSSKSTMSADIGSKSSNAKSGKVPRNSVSSTVALSCIGVTFY
ncbi:hypothetical protein FA95DRAFT_242933 [Auriscalpium vulgare]|uniref:Uncharacterized protein n=1 Tax=Auriscalpium vulgare TaxID=40419 RepID=A0ACB8S6T4_9AGAM|nr:hypothetical protein FA95DRAFT_242933 [Auriscalpium vulgare]